MKMDMHGTDWRNWLEESVSRGCDRTQLKLEMVRICWSPSDASEALAEAFGFEVSRPRIVEDHFSIGGHDIHVLCRLNNPHAVLIRGLISEQEADTILEATEQKGLKPSGVVDYEGGGSVKHDARTSSGCHLTYEECPVLNDVANRISTMTQWPVENSELFQILRYEIGQQYKPHYDWFNPNIEGSKKHLNGGGQRVGTTVVYLHAANSGGKTSFPKAGFEVSPQKGDAVFFANINDTGSIDPNSLHGGTPVIGGVKTIATFWQRENARSI